jgi:hypothetical protein
MDAKGGAPVDFTTFVGADQPATYLLDSLMILSYRKFLIRSQRRLFSA